MTIENNLTVVDKLIDVGGCRLYFSVIQGSDTTILLEVGGGADSTDWGDFPKLLAQEIGATVISYDRAGFGKSELPDTPYNPVEETEWLMLGLRQLELCQDLLLVGHSYGGWRIRLFASQHPAAVRGLVFVDPFSTEFVDLLGVDYLDQHPYAAKNPPFDISNPAALTHNQRGLIRMVKDGLAPKVEMMRKATVPQNIPVRIITAGESWWKTPEEDRAWRKSHEQMEATIAGAKLIVADGCDHSIPEKQPELIVQAVRDVIKQEMETSLKNSTN